MGKGQAVAGLVLGIVGIVLSFVAGIGSIIALPLSIVGLVLAVMGRKKLIASNQPAGIGTAGLVLGIIAVVFSAIFFFTCGICTICVASEAADAADALEDAYGSMLG